jgi:hypothetical protein
MRVKPIKGWLISPIVDKMEIPAPIKKQTLARIISIFKNTLSNRCFVSIFIGVN